VILGASFDTPAENLAFAKDQNFPFRLLRDVDRAVGKQYEVVRDRSDMYSDYARSYAYLIAPDGVIRKAYDVTDVAAHADAVLADIERFSM
jgi:peroxiredoxin